MVLNAFKGTNSSYFHTGYETNLASLVLLHAFKGTESSYFHNGYETNLASLVLLHAFKGTESSYFHNGYETNLVFFCMVLRKQTPVIHRTHPKIPMAFHGAKRARWSSRWTSRCSPRLQGAQRLHPHDRNLDGPIGPNDEEQRISPGDHWDAASDNSWQQLAS